MQKIGPVKRFFRSTAWVVWLSALVIAVTMFMQVFASLNTAGQMGQGIILPHEALAWAFAVIASGYAGTDRLAQFVRTKSLQYGEVDLGDPKKLKRLIWITLLLLAEGVFLTSFFGVPGLALDALATAFGGAGASYVIGNKAIRAASSQEGTHTVEEQPRFYSEEDMQNERSGK